MDFIGHAQIVQAHTVKDLDHDVNPEAAVMVVATEEQEDVAAGTEADTVICIGQEADPDVDTNIIAMAHQAAGAEAVRTE